MSQYTNMITSRTRYLHGCVQKDLLPRASLLLRKVSASRGGKFSVVGVMIDRTITLLQRITDSINLSHQGMGDELMLVLARPISELPGITVSRSKAHILTARHFDCMTKNALSCRWMHFSSSSLLHPTASRYLR